MIGVVAILLVVAFYYDVFSTIHSNEKQGGGYTVVGLEFKGAYSKAGKFMKEVEKKMGKSGISTDTGFGIYYDDPKLTKEEDCRSFVGFILERRDWEKIMELKSEGFKVDSVPVAPTVFAEFPIRSSFSYMIGPWKVYPELSKYMRDKKQEADLTMEIYDTRNRKIIFLMQYH